MGKSLEKTRRHIMKKKGSNALKNGLHINSRDSKRLHRASVRDKKLVDISRANRMHKRQPWIDRANHFKEIVSGLEKTPLEVSEVQDLVTRYVEQYDEELSKVQKARRPGRPTTAAEDRLKMRVTNLKNEHELGFLMPDLTSESNLAILEKFEGVWAYLMTLSWVRVSKGGQFYPASFPPKAEHGGEIKSAEMDCDDEEELNEELNGDGNEMTDEP